MRQLVVDAALVDQIEIDSAGTGAWHEGEAPDRRAQAEARRRGIDISMQQARALRSEDYRAFDYIVAMDRNNLSHMKQRCPDKHRHKLHLCTRFAPDLETDDVPDPYYGGHDGFREVFDMVEASLRGLLREIEAKHLNKK